MNLTLIALLATGVASGWNSDAVVERRNFFWPIVQISGWGVGLVING